MIEKCRAAEGRAYFDELVKRHAKPIMRACYGLVRNPAIAEELAQETFLTAWGKLHLYNGGKFSAWIHKIALNTCLDHLKSAHVTREVGNAAAGDLAVAAPNSDGRLAQEVLTVLNALPAPQRICIKLFYSDGYTYREISRLTGFSVKAVKSHLQNGKRNFGLKWNRRL